MKTTKADTRKVGTLKVRHLDCFKTTEHGEDEIYFHVTAKRERDNKILSNKRISGPDGGNWDMNDRGNRRRRISDIELWRGKFNVGDNVLVIVYIMEEDGGLPQKYARRLADIALSVSGNPYVVAGAIATKFLASLADWARVRDTDDFIGGFTVRLTRLPDDPRTGRVRITWKRTQRWGAMRGEDLGLEPGPDKARKLTFNGDNSRYNIVVD